MSTAQLDLVVLAGYRQFYLQDEGPWESADDLATEGDMLWVGAAAENRLDVRPGVIFVATKTTGYVRVRIGVSAAQPDDDTESHDHVVEASLECRSGNLEVLEETAVLGRLAVVPATYRTRVAWDGLDAAPESNLDERDNPPETIRIDLWPAPRIEPRVVKWYWEWKPKPPEKRPTSPHGLRVLVGEREIRDVLAPYPFSQVIGHQPQPDGSHTALIRDQDGNFWEEIHSQEPPYEPIMFELPESEIRRFELI